MASSADLDDLAHEWLDALVDALVDTPDGPPVCFYVSPGPPIWDFVPSLVVHVGGPSIGDTLPLQPVLRPGTRIAVQGEVNLVQLTATILRCAPEISNERPQPDPAAFNSVASQTNADLWAAWAHTKARKRAGTLFAPREREIFLDPAIALNTEGGATGWQVPIRVELDGYEPA